jgi:UDP-N-acetylmuramoyl-tripeptide--D-alanyl-D-alanine ligase
VIAAPADRIPLETLAAWCAGERWGAAGVDAEGIHGASIDTRTLIPGSLFVPLAGRNTDGHAFLAAAFARGAAAALCARTRLAEFRGREPGPLIVVDDPTLALQEIARHWRERWTGRLIGVTGSVGKTTTKDLVALALATRFVTHRTAGNQNNHWGVPLTLLSLEARHQAAVVEMGMNQPGEIAMLAGLARPQCAVLTGAGRAHLERFNSVGEIAREKAALAFALPPEGVTFVSADAPELLAAVAGAPGRRVTYGFASDADVRPEATADLGAQGMRFQVAGFPPIRLRLVGRHQVANALAVIAVAREWSLDPVAVGRALESLEPGAARMEPRTVRGATLIIDCYNANPDSVRAALETLASWPGSRRRIAVLGDMLELGREAVPLHRETGAAVRDAELWVTGDFAAEYANGARAAGVEVRTFADKAQLADALGPQLGPGVTVLIKGSRGAALEEVVTRIVTSDTGGSGGR